MDLPPRLLESMGFQFEDVEDLIRAVSGISEEEAREIRHLSAIGLPPITSISTLAVMVGYNPSFVYSMTSSNRIHYNVFEIPKKSSRRLIVAPKVGLKAIQTWLSFHFEKRARASSAAFGFVRGRSHVDAAARHAGATWVFSTDITNFFPSVLAARVQEALEELGYRSSESQKIISRLCCYKGRLAQGAPTSPPISNMVLRKLDNDLLLYAGMHSIVYTRYADDIVFSGVGRPPIDLAENVEYLLRNDGWQPEASKTGLTTLPNRLKVHGLLVHGKVPRLTKGYRNRVRAFRHLMEGDKIREGDLNRIAGHINYATFVEGRADRMCSKAE